MSEFFFFPTPHVHEYKVLFFADTKWLRKKEKGHLVGYYMTPYTTSHMLAFNNHEQPRLLLRRV